MTEESTPTFADSVRTWPKVMRGDAAEVVAYQPSVDMVRAVQALVDRQDRTIASLQAENADLRASIGEVGGERDREKRHAQEVIADCDEYQRKNASLRGALQAVAKETGTSTIAHHIARTALSDSLGAALGQEGEG